MTYFEKGKVSLGAINDSEYLYIMLSFRDQPSARFLQSKVTLWLDKTSSKEKLLGFCYFGSSPGMRKEQEFQKPAENFTQRPAEIPRLITVLENKDTLGLIPTNSEKGPAIVTSYQQGFYFHEVRVPLKRSDSVRFAIGTPLDKILSVGLELGSFNPGEFRGMRPKSGEGPISGGILLPKGGMSEGGMGRGSGPGNKPQMPGKQEIWMKLSLAQSSQPAAEKSKENK